MVRPAHESRPGGRVKTHATTVGSRRWRCTMRVDCGRLDPGEWQSHVPERLDEAELADWRAVRDAGLPARSSDDRRRRRCSRRMSGGGGALGAWAWACGGSCCGRPTPALALATVTAVRGLHREGQAEWASPEDVVRAPTSAVNNPDRCGRTVSKITRAGHRAPGFRDKPFLQNDFLRSRAPDAPTPPLRKSGLLRVR